MKDCQQHSGNGVRANLLFSNFPFKRVNKGKLYLPKSAQILNYWGSKINEAYKTFICFDLIIPLPGIYPKEIIQRKVLCAEDPNSLGYNFEKMAIK